MRSRALVAAAVLLCAGALVMRAAAQGKPAATPTVYLRVQIESEDSSDPPVPTLIQSDGFGLYDHGSKGISAFFNGDGELIFRIDPRTSARRVWFDYSTPYGDPPDNASGPVTGLYADATSLLTTVAVARLDGTYVPLQNLPVDTSECVQLQWGYTDRWKTFWSHNFHRPQSAGTVDVSATSYGVVTCKAVDGNGACAKWEVEPEKDSSSRQCGGNGTVPGLARLIDTAARGQRNDSGLYLLPFKLTLMRK